MIRELVMEALADPLGTLRDLFALISVTASLLALGIMAWAVTR